MHNELDDLAPGPELDAAVAVEVMECQVEWRIYSKYASPGSYNRYPTCACTKAPRHNRWWEDRNDDILADYSTSIEAAWEVVEKLSTNGHGMSLLTERFYVEGGKPWCCEFLSKNGSAVHGQGDTAPHAICLAALKAARRAKEEK